MNWKPITQAPLDTTILIRKNPATEGIPLVVVGEVIEYGGQRHHLWKGHYDDTVAIYRKEIIPDWNCQFDLFAEID